MTKSKGLAPILFLIAASLLASMTPVHAAIVAPDLLTPGATITGLPNGGSTGDTAARTILFDRRTAFSFDDGLAGVFRQRVISYADSPSVDHPGLYFDYEIGLTSGSLAAFAISGYGSYQTSVKECGISTCGGSGANGALATSASRSSNGDLLTFDFADILTAGQHSANLQIFSSAALYQDPLAFFVDANGTTFSIEAVAPAPAIPELSTWAMLILGFCGLALFAYRRRNEVLRHGDLSPFGLA